MNMIRIILIVIFIMSFRLYSQSSINQIDSIAFWYSSDSVNIVAGLVSNWFDKSSNGNNASQITSTKRPLYFTNDYRINGQSKLVFDGSNDFFDLPVNCMPNQNYTLYTIVKPTNLTGFRTIIARAYQSARFVFRFNGTNYESIVNLINQGAINQNNNQFFLIKSLYNSQSRKLTVNNFSSTINQSGVIVYNSIDLPTIACLKKNTGATANHFQGEMMEIIMFNKELNLSEQQMVETYLSNKYAPPVNLGVDISIPYGFCNIPLSSPKYYASYLWSTGQTDSTIVINEPGEYWLEGVDIFGRTSRDTIEVFRPPYNDVQLQNQLVCFNQPDTITANLPQGNYSFVQWSDGNTNPIRELNQNETISYTVTDSLSCTRTSNLATITIDNSLENISLGLDTNLCSGNTIQLVQDTSEIISWLWNTGDTTETLAIDTSGIYQLEVTNSNNCSNRDTIQVTVIGTSPTLQYTFTDSLCQFIEGQFSDNSFVANGNGTINNKTWSISEGSVYSGSTGTFAIDTAGTFNVTLLVETIEGCSSSTTFPLTVYPKPILSFTTQNYCPYDAVAFTPANSTFSILNSTFWDFDDNTTSNSSNPIHVFGTTGTYNVSLQAQDINGCRDTVTQAVYIQPAPVAAFSCINTCEETEVNFTNNSNISDTFNITTNTWTYGDGTQAINPSFQKIYADADTFDVQLIVTANNGCQDTSMQSIIIYPRPTLGWQVGPTCKNTWTTFENLSSVSVGNIAQTNWLVNLQYPLEGGSSAYQFVTTGVQYLNLTSTTDNGCYRDTLIIVNVQPEINAAYTVTPQTIVAGVPTTFTSTSTGATQYTWNLGDTNPIQTTNSEPVEIPGFDPTLVGDSIQTSLIIENTIGCRDTATQYIKVYEPRIDLAITQLFVQDLNGFYKVGVELRNQGFVEITKTDLLLKMYGSIPIMETETESLAPGESRIYLFNASPSAYISTQDNETSYLCVEATSYNDFQLIETKLSNNIACLNTEGENFVLLPIYPNPTNDDITYTLVVSEESTITMSLTDETGRIVQSSTELFASGLHTPTLSMRNLRAGVYYFQMSDGLNSKTVKVLKN